MQRLFEARTIEAQAKLLDGYLATRAPLSRPIRLRAGENAPLAPEQEGLWYLWKLNPASSAYIIAFSLHLSGPLSAEKLRLAIDAVVARHAVLRTRFEEREGSVQQIIAPSGNVAWVEHDLSAESDPNATASRRTKAALLTPFDLEAGPPIRVELLRLGSQRHILSLSLHHIVSDGWSIRLLLGEIAAHYSDAPLHPLAIQYGDYAAWQRRRLTDQTLNQQIAYWRGRLGSEQPILELPTDRPRGVRRGEASGRLMRSLPSELEKRVRSLATASRTTVSTLMLTAFAVLLYRSSGQRDVRIAAPISNRRRVETEGLIGFFVNTVVIRVELSGSMTAATALAQTHARMLEAQANQDVPFERVVEALQPARIPNRNPMTQVKFVMQEDWGQLDRIGEASCIAIDPIEVAPRFDLALDVVGGSRGLKCEFTYASDLFEEPTVARLAGQFLRVLEAMCDNPQGSIGAMELVGEHVDPDGVTREAGVLAHVARHAAATPELVAMIHGGRELVWRDLWSWSGRLAARLAELGVANEDCVAIALPRGLALAPSILAVWRTGAAYVPLDLDAPSGRLARQIADCGARVMICESQPAFAAGIVSIAPDECGAGSPPVVWPRQGQAAYVIYTSGSTGEPKGVVVSHGALSSYLDAIAETLPPSIRSAAYVSTPAADLGHTVLFGAMRAGWTLHLLTREQAGDADAFAAYMASQAIDLLKITPSHLAGLLHAAHPADVLPRRCLIVGGEATSAALAARISALNPESSVLNHYGPTEATVGVITRSGTDTDRDLLPLGRPLSNSVARVLDPDGNRVSQGVAGEALRGRRGLGARLYGTSRADGGTFCARPLRPAWLPALSHRGQGARTAERRTRVSRTTGRPGEDPRIPRGARRGRVCASHGARRHGRGRHCKA